jgi:CRP-like cAMP-binding protein
VYRTLVNWYVTQVAACKEKKRREEEEWKTLRQQCREWLEGDKPEEGLVHMIEWGKKSGNFTDLRPDQQRTLMRRLNLRKCEANDIIFLQGQPGQHYYLLLSGTASLYEHKRGERAEAEARHLTANKGAVKKNDIGKNLIGRKFFTFPVSAAFGEHSLITSSKRSCSCMAEEEGCELLVLDAESYMELMFDPKGSPADCVGARIAFLQTLQPFGHWSGNSLTSLAYSLERREYARANRIVKHNYEATELTLIVDGRASVVLTPNENNRTVYPKAMAVVKEQNMDRMGQFLHKTASHAAVGPRIKKKDEVQLSSLGSGEIMGVSAMVMEGATSYGVSVLAQSAVTVYTMSRKSFDMFIRNGKGSQGRDTLRIMEQMATARERMWQNRLEQAMEAKERETADSQQQQQQRPGGRTSLGGAAPTWQSSASVSGSRRSPPSGNSSGGQRTGMMRRFGFGKRQDRAVVPCADAGPLIDTNAVPRQSVRAGGRASVGNFAGSKVGKASVSMPGTVSGGASNVRRKPSPATQVAVAPRRAGARTSLGSSTGGGRQTSATGTANVSATIGGRAPRASLGGAGASLQSSASVGSNSGSGAPRAQNWEGSAQAGMSTLGQPSQFSKRSVNTHKTTADSDKTASQQVEILAQALAAGGVSCGARQSVGTTGRSQRTTLKPIR